MAQKIFNVPTFFVVFRESLEAAIVISVLLSFIKQSLGNNDPALHKKLVRQVWFGAGIGLFICLVIGAGFIGAYYSLQKNLMGDSEDIWEGVFCLIAAVMISFMGIAMLRINKMQAKWRVKIARSLVEAPKKKRDRFRISYLTKKYAMFLLPFVTVLREGLEAVVFVAGTSAAIGPAADVPGAIQRQPAKSYPLPVVCGLLAGALIGVLLYKGASYASLQIFLIISTAILYLIAAGLFSRGVWYFETNTFNKGAGGDASESGSGNGSYDVTKAVYHVNCCNPEMDNGWDIFNALLGWQNTGYLGSILAYNLYWLTFIIIVGLMLFEERKGHLPFCKNLTLVQLNPMYWLKNKKKYELTDAEREALFEKAKDIRFTETGEIYNSNETGEVLNTKETESASITNDVK